MNDQLAFNKAKALLLSEISDTVVLDQSACNKAFRDLNQLVLGELTPYEACPNLDTELQQDLRAILEQYDQVEGADEEIARQAKAILEHFFGENYIVFIDVLKRIMPSPRWAEYVKYYM